VYAYRSSTSTANTLNSSTNKQLKADFQFTKVHLIAQKTGTWAKDCGRYVACVRAQPRGMRFGTRTSVFYWIEARMQGGMASPVILLQMTSPLVGAVIRLLSRADDA